MTQTGTPSPVARGSCRRRAGVSEASTSSRTERGGDGRGASLTTALPSSAGCVEQIADALHQPRAMTDSGGAVAFGQYTHGFHEPHAFVGIEICVPSRPQALTQRIH